MSTINHTDLLTPAELAGRLKVPKSWVYEKTRGPKFAACLGMTISLQSTVNLERFAFSAQYGVGTSSRQRRSEAGQRCR